ncbi:MAG: hypothetical protein LRY55_05885 [Leadbetterella sp.]|nr:hypothetical protein [Leadbetterella sp.]
MKYLLPLLLLSHLTAAQWVGKGQVMVEAGALPAFSTHLKAGYVFRDNVVAGVFAEHQDLFTEISETGVFGRKYMLDKRRVNFYLQGGASVGRYKLWSWGFEKLSREEKRRDRTFTALKFIGGCGVNWRLGDRMSLGHEFAVGISNYREYSFPSSHFTFNYRFGPKP